MAEMDENIFSNDGRPSKRKRQGRRSSDQLEYMVDYLIQNPHVATGKFYTLNAKDALKGSWEELAQQLNNMRSSGQSIKNVKSWKESWRDQNTKTSKKAGALRSARVQTGNRKTNLPQLSELDKKVLSLMGHEYVEGTSSPDSWPKEQENNVQRMAAGDEEIFLIDPTPLTLNSTEQYTEESELDTLLVEFDSGLVDDVCQTFNVSEPSTSKNNTEETYRGPTIPKKPKTGKQKLSCQLQTARDSFSLIAEKLVEANKLIADSLSVIGKALEKMVDNESRRLANENKLLELYDKILDKI